MGIKKKFSRKQQYELVASGKKGCSGCGKVLPLDCFVKQNTKLGYRSHCRYCRHVDQLARKGKVPMEESDFWHRHGCRDGKFIDKNGKMRCPERDRVNAIRYQYNVNFKKGLNLYKKSEKGSCEICGKSKEENGIALAVDHCHTSGEVRGILCQTCNHGLGNFRDDIEFLKNAIKYLEKDNDQ